MPGFRSYVLAFASALAASQPALAADDVQAAAGAVASAEPMALAALIEPTAQPAVLDASPHGFNPARLPFAAGTYSCELNRKVHVRSVTPDLRSAVVHWDRKDYTLSAVDTRTGALRYEDTASGLVWLVIVGKSMLLDTRRGQQLANECKT